MKIFIGHSFKDEDKDIVERIKKFVQSSNFECITGERSENLSVSQKVQERIKQCDIFIGIFTREKPLYEGLFKKPVAFTTSAWVIQESGYAIAECKNVIFLFEEQVLTKLGLQADSEYLVFDRDKPLDEMFTKLNEMLANIQSKKDNNACENINADKNAAENEETKTTINSISNEEDSHKIDLEIYLDYSQDYKTVKTSYDELIKQTEDEEKKIEYRATFLYRSELLGEDGSIDKLLELSKTHPSNSFIKLKLAKYYEKLKAFEQSANLYKEVSEAYKEKDVQIYADMIYHENKCISSHRGYDIGLQNIKNGLLENFDNRYLFKSVALLAHENEDWNTFFNYAECYLKREPKDANVRFKLAYAYSNQNKNNLSFYHYKILNNTSKSGTYYNNIAVLYDKLGLNTKSVDAYKKAIELNETLSISNLVNLYINGGFIEEAKELLSKIDELKQRGVYIHPNIGNAESRLSNTKTNDNEKEDAIFNDAQKENNFMTEYAEKFCALRDIDYSRLSGAWKTHEGEYAFEFKENFECVFKIKQKSSTEYSEFGIKGKITNLSFKADIKTRECNISPYTRQTSLFGEILGLGSCSSMNKVYGIISDDYSEIKICLVDEKKVAYYYTWEKIAR